MILCVKRYYTFIVFYSLNCVVHLSSLSRTHSSTLVVFTQIPLRVWRVLLPPDGVCSGDLSKRDGADHHSLHCGALRSHLSPLPNVHRQQAESRRQVHRRHLATSPLLGHAPGTNNSICMHSDLYTMVTFPPTTTELLFFTHLTSTVFFQ